MRIEESSPIRGNEPVEAGIATVTCSVREFAAIIGVSRDRAYELVNSAYPPPGFKVGKGYRIITARIAEYLDGLYERELAMRGRRI